MTGQWPEREIDHINLDRHDNRFSNLRLASRKENARNLKVFRSNTSGYKGVCFVKYTGKWQVQIKTDEGRKYLGQFATAEQAAAVYAAAAESYHGDFARVC